MGDRAGFLSHQLGPRRCPSHCCARETSPGEISNNAFRHEHGHRAAPPHWAWSNVAGETIQLLSYEAIPKAESWDWFLLHGYPGKDSPVEILGLVDGLADSRHGFWTDPVYGNGRQDATGGAYAGGQNGPCGGGFPWRSSGADGGGGAGSDSGCCCHRACAPFLVGPGGGDTICAAGPADAVVGSEGGRTRPRGNQGRQVLASGRY